MIADYGREHCRTGKLIVYTSADSVFQVAAHEEIVPPEELYRSCRGNTVSGVSLPGPLQGSGRIRARRGDTTSRSPRRG